LDTCACPSCGSAPSVSAAAQANAYGLARWRYERKRGSRDIQHLSLEFHFGDDKGVRSARRSPATSKSVPGLTQRSIRQGHRLASSLSGTIPKRHRAEQCPKDQPTRLCVLLCKARLFMSMPSAGATGTTKQPRRAVNRLCRRPSGARREARTCNNRLALALRPTRLVLAPLH
jgi:hypothetical protein